MCAWLLYTREKFPNALPREGLPGNHEHTGCFCWNLRTHAYIKPLAAINRTTIALITELNRANLNQVTMSTRPFQSSLSLLVMCAIVQALMMCTYSMECEDLDLECKICTHCQGLIDSSLFHAFHDDYSGSPSLFSFNETFDLSNTYKRNAHWSGIDGEEMENIVSILDGICNLLALRDLSEHVEDASAADLGGLLQQNVQDACMWLYDTSDPNIPQCEISLRYYCFRDMTHGPKMNLMCRSYRQY